MLPVECEGSMHPDRSLDGPYMHVTRTIPVTIKELHLTACGRTATQSTYDFPQNQ